MPILIVGGTHDPLVALEAQERDYALLASLDANVTFSVFENVGHQVGVEAPKCLAKTVNGFLNSSSIGAAKVICLEQNQ